MSRLHLEVQGASMVRQGTYDNWQVLPTYLLIVLLGISPYAPNFSLLCPHYAPSRVGKKTQNIITQHTIKVKKRPVVIILKRQ